MATGRTAPRYSSKRLDSSTVNIPENSAFQVSCRGLPLVAFKATSGVVFCCVHQLAIELWNSFDTPRVSVQKKLEDLDITVHHCDKAQVKMLRDTGIIKNYRATMIRYHDALRLYDALEYSRRKRGLEKHALKSNFRTPGQRAQRQEEQRARKLAIQTANRSSSLYGSPPAAGVCTFPANDEQTHASDTLENHNAWCASNETIGDDLNLCVGASSSSNIDDWQDITLSLDALLAVESPVKAGGKDCLEHHIELVPNAISPLSSFASLSLELSTASEDAQQSQSAVRLSPRHMDPSVRNLPLNATKGGNNSSYSTARHSHTNIAETIVICDSQPSASLTVHSSSSSSSQTTLQSNSNERALTITNHNRQSQLPTPRSPILESSEGEEQSSGSVYSVDSSHRLSSTPERFLRFDGSSSSSSDSDSEVESIYSSSSSESEPPDVFDEEYLPPKSVLGCAPSISMTSKNRVVATKLRHFAHTSSPHTSTLAHPPISLGKRLPRCSTSSSAETTPSKPHPLVISVPVSMLGVQVTKPSSHQRTQPPQSISSSSGTASSKRGKSSKNRKRPTALSSFVTKKRAINSSSRSSSPCSSSTSEYDVIYPTDGKTAKKRKTSSHERAHKPPAAITSSTIPSHIRNKGKSLSSSSGQLSMSGKKIAQIVGENWNHLRCNSVSSAGNTIDPTCTIRGELEQHSISTAHDQRDSMYGGVGMGSNVSATNTGGNYSLHQPSLVAIDDDQLSIASSSTNYSTNSRGGGSGHVTILTNGMTRSGRTKNKSATPNESNELKTTIKFEEVFRYLPPKLVVRDGELQPEQSLSVKKLDRHTLSSLPDSHPFLSWSLGQPTRTSSKCPRKRKVGSNSKPFVT